MIGEDTFSIFSVSLTMHFGQRRWNYVRFVGMLPSEQLQTYLVRAVTGQGARVQEKDFSAQDLAAAQSKVINMAGMCMQLIVLSPPTQRLSFTECAESICTQLSLLHTQAWRR